MHRNCSRLGIRRQNLWSHSATDELLDCKIPLVFLDLNLKRVEITSKFSFICLSASNFHSCSWHWEPKLALVPPLPFLPWGYSPWNLWHLVCNFFFFDEPKITRLYNLAWVDLGCLGMIQSLKHLGDVISKNKVIAYDWWWCLTQL